MAQTSSVRPGGVPTAAAHTASPGTPHIVIVGAGFGGIEVAKALQGASASVTVIDRRNYTLFQPLLYQVATAALSPADIATPIRALLHASNIDMLLDEVVELDAEGAQIKTRSGRQLGYDLLVLATGSSFNYFGNDGWSCLAPSPKCLSDAVEIRRRLLLAFERAEMCDDEYERRALMTFVVVGAGPTGVEMAGAIAELARATLRRDFRRINPSTAQIILVEAGGRVLAGFPKKLGDYANEALADLGVQVLLNTKVHHIDGNGIVAGGGRIEARTVIWGAGVRTKQVPEWLHVKPGPHGAVKVERDFSVPGLSNVFIIGDAAEAIDADGKPLPGLAAVAKQEGHYVGQLLRRRLAGHPDMPPFRYRDYGTMATIGRSAAVADLRGFHMTGTLAWFLWGLVHLYFLIGFRNRLVVLVNWLWAWVSYARGARLITDPPAPYAGAEPAYETPPPPHEAPVEQEAVEPRSIKHV
jgi:NADH:ubiquinone reductase (H+-translocating)